MTKIRTQDEN